MKKLLLLLIFIPFVSFGQVSENIMTRIVETLNKESPITDPRTGVTMTGAMSYSNTLVYLYEVPDEWYPPDDMKEILIENFQTAEIGEVYIKAKINVDFNYYKGNRLIKKINIKHNEFKNKYDNNGDLIKTETSINELGKYINFKDHLKAKGLSFRVKAPLGFKQSEADRPNIIQKWVKNIDDDMVSFMILVYKQENEVKDITKEEWKQYLKDEDGVDEYASYIPGASNQEYFVIDNYPGVIIDVVQKVERLNLDMDMYMTQISVFVEEYSFQLQLISSNKTIKDNYKNLFYLFANSVIFPFQY